jgi:putative Mg2+ transporter-C (MgtC) family protein
MSSLPLEVAELRIEELVIRLLPALIFGGLVGLNRDLRGKPVGFRTLALVGMGSALITYVGSSIGGPNDGSASRVLQGIITGIGFLGAGVILQPSQDEKVREVRGLTTAACVWMVACLGAASGAGLVIEASVVTIFVLAVLAFGGLLERGVERWFKKPPQGG